MRSHWDQQLLVEREQREHIEKQKQMLRVFLERQVQDRKIQEAQEREKVREQDLLVSTLRCDSLIRFSKGAWRPLLRLQKTPFREGTKSSRSSACSDEVRHW